MLKKKNLVLSAIYYINVIFFSFQFLFNYINCACGECAENCLKDCRKSIFNDDIQFYCRGITSASTKYFYIYQYSEFNGECHFIDKCPDKVVANTKECVPNCKNLYEVGDFCFEGLDPDNDYSPLIDTPNYKKYKCKYYTYIELIDEREYHICIDDPEDPPETIGKVRNVCPSYHYDKENKICVDSCGNKKIKIKTGNNNDDDVFSYFECRNECEYSSEFEYDESIDINTSKNIYCLNNCPPKTPFYYIISDNRSPKCIKKCNKNHFYNNQKQCISSCNGLYYKDNSNDFFYCDPLIGDETIDNKNCPDTHPYKYQKACLKSCTDTQLNIILFDIITYSLTIDNNKKCVEDCNLEYSSYYSDEDSFSCVDDCSKTKNKFHYNYKCVNSCLEKGFKYYTMSSLDLSTSSSSSLDISSELKCVNDCEEPYSYKYSNICLRHCPKLSDKPYINETTNECTSCKIPQDPLNPKSGEGFLKNNDIEGEDITCYKSCPPGLYYKINDNICYKFPSSDEEENDIIKNCFFSEDNLAICYPSCKDIPGNIYLYSNKVDRKNICYKNFNCGNKYYYRNGDHTKCIEPGKSIIPNYGEIDNYILECRKQNYNYLKGKECVQNCNEKTDYKIEPIKTIYHGITTLGKCCSTPDCDTNYRYYSESDKILNKECSLKLIKDKEEDGDDKIKISTQGNCVLECPSDYPYESKDGKYCLSTCPNFYYNIGNTKKCIDNCKDINKFNFNGEKECLDNCSKKEGIKVTYYYYDSNNICYTSCKELDNNKFSLKATISHQECLSKCPESYKYYFESDNLCLLSCSNGFYQFKDNDIICVTQCDNEQVVINSNNTCIQECPPEEPFIVSVPLKEGSSIMIDKCISNCKIFNPRYKYYHSEKKRCLEECTPDVPYKIDNNKCIDKCPEGYFTESFECKIKCTTQYYIKNEDNSYKCVQNCDLTEYYISSSGECVVNCGMSENFIGKNRRCKNYYNKDEDEIYYKEFKKIKNELNEIIYIIYIFLQSYGTNPDVQEYLVHGTNEIVENECPLNKPYLSENGKICYSKCIFDSSLPFSTIDNNKKICSFECKGEKIYYGEDKICLENCDSFPFNKTINDEDNSCVEKCNLSSLYKFETEIDGKLHCSKQCANKYSEEDFICRDKCLPPYNYVYENKCLKECPKNKFAHFNNDNNEYECKDNCDTDFYYYEKNRICIEIENCNDYIIQNTNECISNCSSINSSIKYYFYDYNDNGNDDDILSGTNRKYEHNTCVDKCPEDKPFLRENNHCFKECNSETYPYYKEEDKICLKKCPSEMKKDGYICKIDCPKEKYLDTKTNECIDSCLNSSNKFYYYTPPNNECLEKCAPSLYINNYECLQNCPIDNNKYADLNNKCVNVCPEIRNYVIKEFTHNEEDTQQKCLSSCTKEYPYYYNKGSINECVAICSYYILPDNKNIISIECFENGCPNNYDYFIKYDNGTNQCLRSCPEDMPYYKASEGKKECFKKCPNEYPYFKYNSYECSDICDTNIIDYETKECLISCSSSQYFAKDGDKIYCIKECNKNLGEYLSLNGECVKSCEQDDYLIKDITNPLYKTCNCELLFYFDNSGKKHCFPPEIKECGKEDAEQYKYRIYNTNQCSKYCFGYLSPSEDFCYLNENNCEQIDINTYLVINNNQLKCDCKYKFYIDRASKKKICLGENEKCPDKYYMYTPNTKECVEECKEGYNFVFDNKCFNACPIIEGVFADLDNCKCNENKNWYKIGENNIECTDSCGESFPYIIEDTKECVKKCKGTNYEVFYKNQCHLSCSSIDGMNGMVQKEIKDDDNLKEIATYTCQCQYYWYYNNGEIECLSSDEKCPDEYNNLVKDTNQCVKSCPESHNYYFNNECFKNCQEAKEKYQLPVKAPNSNSKECICDNLWKKDIDGNNYKVECIKNSICEKYMVNETKECVDECTEYPLEFNNQCYKKGSCPKGTKEDIINGGKCICNNLWHEQKNGNINCIEGDECPQTHPYKIFSEKKCSIDPCSSEEYIINNTCYNECPDGTKIKKNKNEDGTTTDTKECECDSKFGYWYIEGEEKPKMICELSECPPNKQYYKNETKECISSCEENQLYKFNKICYENECPYPTVSENIKTNKYECTIKKFTTAKNIDESYKYLKEEIIELYKSVPKGGLIYKNFSSTIHIYGINQNDSETKNLTLRSSLSYIDISSCLDKIYTNNKMHKKDDIVVLKYDLDNQTTKSLVKPVEYEFINSRTGQILDMSVCTKDDIVVSYSLSDILNYNTKKNKRKLKIMKKMKILIV